ncbi:hypothetical protein [Streptomyces oryzae]|uniref:hypothetical protein n=1 Tax=Streptomyces oryzae TaxID=1434886 RepID=UPI001FFE132F|nr:hypothetical protein [Streptomyces oryzae]
MTPDEELEAHWRTRRGPRREPAGAGRVRTRPVAAAGGRPERADRRQRGHGTAPGADRTALLLTVAGFLGSALILRADAWLRPALAHAAVRTRGGTRRLLADPRVRALLLLCRLPPLFSAVPEGLAVSYAEALTGAVGTACVVGNARSVRRLQRVPDRPVGS